MGRGARGNRSRAAPVRRFVAEIGYRLSGWPRRLIAAGCLTLAVLAALSERRRAAPDQLATVVVAAHDLPAGSALGPGDVRLARWPSATVPSAALRTAQQAVGAVLAAPMTAGEPFTTARLRGRGLAAGLPAGFVAITVALADPAGAQLLQAGDVVDLVASSSSAAVGPATATALVLATRVRVLAVLAVLAPSARAGGDVGSDAARLVVATDTAGALRIAGATGSPIVATLRAPP